MSYLVLLILLLVALRIRIDTCVPVDGQRVAGWLAGWLEDFVCAGGGGKSLRAGWGIGGVDRGGGGCVEGGGGVR